MFKKVLPWVIITILAIALIVQWVQLRRFQKSLEVSNHLITERLNSFDAKLGRAETRIDSTGELIEQMKDGIPDEIRQDLSDVMARIDAIGVARVQHTTGGGGEVRRREPLVSRTGDPSSVDRVDEGTQESREWEFKDWRLTASLTGNTFRYTLTQEFDVMLVEGSKADGHATYLRIWELDGEGNRILPPLEITDFKVIRRDTPKKSFMVFNPKLDVSLASSLSIPNGDFRIAPELGVSLMSYGETKDDLTWRFIRLGASYNGEAAGLSISPFSYNVGKELPLVSNVWLSPAYIWSDSHGIGLTIGGAL